jgi:hypothetical protein
LSGCFCRTQLLMDIPLTSSSKSRDSASHGFERRHSRRNREQETNEEFKGSALIQEEEDFGQSEDEPSRGEENCRMGIGRWVGALRAPNLLPALRLSAWLDPWKPSCRAVRHCSAAVPR